MDELRARVEVQQERLSILEQEVLRTRGRLHDMEGDRAALRLLVEQVKGLTQSLESFYMHAESIAELAVEKVLLRRGSERRETRKYWMGWAGFSVMAAGFLIDRFVHFL